MRINVEWDEADIEAGIYVYRNETQSSVEENISYFKSVLWKVGYSHDFEGRTKDNDNRYCLIALTDGLVVQIGTKKELAKHLTEEKYIPCQGHVLVKLLTSGLI